MGKPGSNEKGGGLTRHPKAFREKNIDKELEKERRSRSTEERYTGNGQNRNRSCSAVVSRLVCPRRASLITTRGYC